MKRKTSYNVGVSFVEAQVTTLYFPQAGNTICALASPLPTKAVRLCGGPVERLAMTEEVRENYCHSEGERWERCRWQMKRPERVAAVGVQRSRTDGKAHTGHPNRK